MSSTSLGINKAMRVTEDRSFMGKSLLEKVTSGEFVDVSAFLKIGSNEAVNRPVQRNDVHVRISDPDNPSMDIKEAMRQIRRVDMDSFSSQDGLADERIREYLTNRNYRCALAFADEGKMIVGFALFRPQGILNEANQGHLYRIGIRNGWQKSGNGSALMTQVIEDLRRLGKTEVTLTYSNDALGFYINYVEQNKLKGLSLRQIKANYYAIEIGGEPSPMAVLPQTHATPLRRSSAPLAQSVDHAMEVNNYDRIQKTYEEA